ncbi:MAG: S-layer homology domain-containing protein, partial [Clostridia bacterium]|nr:S-layer homology domain-containing protein [Clostridia bacterium]
FGMTTPVMILWVVPGYIGMESSADVTVYIGKSKDPNKSLEQYKNNDGIVLEKTEWNTDIYGHVNGSGIFGVGIDNALGIKTKLGAEIELAYSAKMPKWYPRVAKTGFGAGADLVASGTLEVIGMKIPLASFSYPLPFVSGFLKYFRDVRIGNRTITYVQKGIDDIIREGKESQYKTAIDECRRRISSLELMIDNQEVVIRGAINSLREYAYKNGIIGWYRYYASQCTRLGGLLSLGELTAADMNEDAVNDEGFYVEPAHNSKWVANDNDAELESAFKPVSSHTIMKDAVSQPHSKIINIGNGRMLVVFLMNDPDNTEDPAQMLAYSVYDTKKDEWTTPEFISKDGTTDSIPDLCIGGESNDKVYITWSSLGDTTNIEDPADYLSTSDIYFATFDMATAKIDDGSIVRLTNDNVYDNNPKVVFDSFSGDIMVTYTKTQQDKTEQFDNNTEKLTNLISPYNNYNTIAYMLYDGEQHKWLTDSYFDTEIASAKTQEEFVEKWQGQRFFDATIQSADGTKTDPAVYDLTTGISGDDGNMILAYTASTGADPTKPEDRDVYVKVYDFTQHIFSEPVRITNDNVAQSMPKIVTTGIDTYLFWYENNKDMMYVNLTEMFEFTNIDENGKFVAGDFEIDGKDGKYAGNIIDGKFSDDYTPAIARVSMESVTNDDSFGAMTSYDIYTEMVGEPGDMYENMYIVWSKTVPYYEENEEGEEREASALELFATARIVEKTGDAEIADAEASNKESANATWSQPYRLTSNYMMNDGAAAAVDDDGNLVLVHNQYTMTYRGDDQEFMSNPDNVRVITRKNEDGEEQQFLEGDLYETSPVDLVITKCEPCGSLDVDNFSFSDDYPMGGEEITVTAAVENAGLKTAYGAEIEFYEYKDGKRGKLVKKVTTDKEVGVNEAYKTTFTWTMPENTEDIEGLGLVAVMKEKNPDTSGYYDATEAYSDPFKLQSVLETGLEYVEQEGDHFEIAYRVYNSGNKEVEEGTKLNLNLSALYGDAKEVYGVDDTTLKTIDVAGIKPRTDFVKGDELEIPKSVFEYCGYDAIYPEIYNAEGERVAVGEDTFAVFNEPMNFTVNGGKDITLNVGDTITPEVSYSSIDSDGKDINVVYTIDDTSVATVKDGVVTAVGAGETTMTVTLMPYGMEKTVKITVNGENKKHSSGGGGGSGSSNKVSIYQSGNSANGKVSVSNANPAKGDTVTVTVTPKDGFEVDKLTVTDNKGNEIEVIKNDDGTYSFIQPDSKVTVKAEYRKADGTDSDNGSGKSDGSGEKWFKDVPESSWYYAPIKEAFTGGRMAGMSEDYFEPETDITRGMFASAVYRLEGSPETDAVNRFDDVKEGSYYETAIAWATENGIVAGYDDATYGPDDPITREQLAAILYRYANYKSIDVSVGEDTNILDYGDASEISEYAVSAIRWACGAGILTGFEDITLRPQNNANRAQMAVILNKISEIF